MNPNKRVYIVLFVLPDIRGPPQAFSYSIKTRRMLMYTKEKNFFKNVGKSGRLNCEYIVEAQKFLQIFFDEEKCVVANENLTVNQFKKKVRISLLNLKINKYKRYIRLCEKEVLMDEIFLFEGEFQDDYSFLENKVTVMNFKMTVKNDLLYAVLNAMEQPQRDIIYLSLCEEMSDREIGERLQMSRSKVQRIKQQMKIKIYNAMTGGTQNDRKT